MSIFYTTYESPLGPLRIYGNQSAILGLTFCTQTFTCDETLQYIPSDALPHFKKTIAYLTAYMQGVALPMDIPLSPKGTEFQHRVWQALLAIPYGQSTTYGVLSKLIFHSESPKGAQAIGRAVGANPISILIPCHRVLGKDHTLTGYSGGLPIKESLLQLESIRFTKET